MLFLIMIDLHVHTTASDGQYTPTQIIQKAVDKKIKAIAITDHDTFEGINEGQIASKQYNITFIPGIEINITYTKGEFHLLGLNIHQPSNSLLHLIQELQLNRTKRNEEIISRMNDDGFKITWAELEQMFPNTVIGRPHIAQILVEKNIVKTRQQAFDQYLANGRKWYIQRVGANLDESIIAIKESGGLPIIAHPMSLYQSWGKLPEIIKEYKDRGVVGLEAFHPGARVSECLRLEELAHSLGMVVTGGSDFHGEQVRADRRLGHTCGGKKIEDRLYFEELLPHLST